jgi:hypothetical protein
MRPDIRRAFIWMTAFYIAMAYLESAVVMYLRALYYPRGFDFPLVPMEGSLVMTEVFREAATILMLLAPAALITRSALERFAWFCFGFGIWDIFYYVWLKALLDWPSSLLSRDLLFLIPVPWVGPVWAPCLIALGLVMLALVILRGRSRNPAFRIDAWSWSLLVGGALHMVVSFTIDPLLKVNGLDAASSVSSLGDAGAMALMRGRDYIPEHYPWPRLAAGMALALTGLARLVNCQGTARTAGC